MASLQMEPTTPEEEIQMLKAEIIILRHDVNNLKTMTEYMYNEFEILSEIINGSDRII